MVEGARARVPGRRLTGIDVCVEVDGETRRRVSEWLPAGRGPGRPARGGGGGGGGGWAHPPNPSPFKPLLARFVIVFAGPGMNFVLAAVIAALVFMIAGQPVSPAVLGHPAPDGPAARAGLRAGGRRV